MRAAASYLAPAPEPRQLDIVEDTELKPRAVACAAKYSASSTAPKAAKYSALSTAPKSEKYSASSTASQIDKRRKLAGISHEELCRKAGISTRNWLRVLRGEQKPMAATMAKLDRALSGQKPPLDEGNRRNFLQSYLRRTVRDLARQSGWDPVLMLSQDFSSECTNDPVWLQAARLRRCAIYLMVEGLLDGKRAPVAHAIGLTRQAVHKGVAAIEAERMRDHVFDAWMQRAMDEIEADR